MTKIVVLITVILTISVKNLNARSFTPEDDKKVSKLLSENLEKNLALTRLHVDSLYNQLLGILTPNYYKIAPVANYSAGTQVIEGTSYSLFVDSFKKAICEEYNLRNVFSSSEYELFVTDVLSNNYCYIFKYFNENKSDEDNFSFIN